MIIFCQKGDSFEWILQKDRWSKSISNVTSLNIKFRLKFWKLQSFIIEDWTANKIRLFVEAEALISDSLWLCCWSSSKECIAEKKPQISWKLKPGEALRGFMKNGSPGPLLRISPFLFTMLERPKNEFSFKH